MVFMSMKDYISDKKAGKKAFEPINPETNDEITAYRRLFNEWLSILIAMLIR